MAQERKIIFDFDGVLVSSDRVSFAITRRRDAPDMSYAQYQDLFVGNVFEIGSQRRFPTFENAQTKAEYYREYGTELMKLAPVPGMPELVALLAERHPLHIVSSADERSINAFLRAYTLDRYFTSVLGYETAESKVEKFRMLHVHEQPQSHLFITDTLGDLREAAKVSLPSIAVSWGVHDNARLREAPTIAIVHTPDELSAAIQRFVE